MTKREIEITEETTMPLTEKDVDRLMKNYLKELKLIERIESLERLHKERRVKSLLVSERFERRQLMESPNKRMGERNG